MKKFLVFSLLCFHLSADFVQAGRSNDRSDRSDRNDRDLYEKNKVRLQQKKRENLQGGYYFPHSNDYPDPSYNQNYHYQHEYQDAYYQPYYGP